MIVIHDLFETQPNRAVYLLLSGEGATRVGAGPDPWAAAEAALRTAREIRAQGRIVPGGIRVVLVWQGGGIRQGVDLLELQDPAGAWFPLRRLPEVLSAWGERAAGWAVDARHVELQALRGPDGVQVCWAAAFPGGHLMVQAVPIPDGARVRVDGLRTRRAWRPEEVGALRAAAGPEARWLEISVSGLSMLARWEAPGQSPLTAVEAVVRGLAGRKG